MDYIQAIELLDQDRLAGAVFLYGEEAYLAEYLVDLIKDKYLDESSYLLNYEKIDQDRPDIRRVIEATETLPFMADKRIIELRGLDLSRDGISRNKDFFNDLEDYLPRINQDSILLIQSTSGKFFKGSLYKEAQAGSIIVELNRLNKRQLANFIGKKLARSGIKINRQNLSDLVDGLGYADKDLGLSLYDVENELDKIIATADGRVAGEDVQRVLNDSQTGNIFKLTDAICNLDPATAIRNFLLLNEYQDNYQVFYMIIRQFRNIMNIKLLKEKGYLAQDIKKIIGLKDFEYNKLSRFEKNYTMEDLKNIYKDLYETDLNLKSKGASYKSNILSLIASLADK